MNAQTFSSEELHRRTLERRAIEAAIWGVPIVSMHAMREAFFRDAKAKYNDIVLWSKPSDWQNQTTTPSASPLWVLERVHENDAYPEDWRERSFSFSRL